MIGSDLRPDEYEHLVAAYFDGLGYSTEVSPYTNDYGVDVLAVKGDVRVAIQAKMYGRTSRSVNRQMIMELHGVKDFFDCTRAVLVTDGKLLDNAREAASKLGIEIVILPAERATSLACRGGQEGMFEQIWEEHVMPLEGKTLIRSNGKTNKIVKVDWSGVVRITSNGNHGSIKIEIFKKVINHLLLHGEISRQWINDEYLGRASSGVILILSHTPVFDLVRSPMGLTVKNQVGDATD